MTTMDRFNTSSKLNNLKKEYSEIQEFLKNTNPEIGEKISRILNESHIYQIELEIQNEELRSIQIELEALKNEYFELYNNAPIGYLVLDSKAIIQKANVCFQNYLGLTGEELLYKPLNSFISERDRSDFLSIYSSFFKNPKNKIFDYEFLTASNNSFNGRIVGTKLKNSVFEPSINDKILVVVSDISIQKLYERKMDELISNKSKFISTIAHDIRNPLNSMLGYSQFLKAEYKNISENELAEYLTNFDTAGKNLYQLIDNLLDLSKINFDNNKTHLVSIDQNQTLGEIIKGVSDILRKKNIKIFFEPKEELFCLCDKFMISTVYRNLITNAIKFTKEKGNILIDSYQEGNYGIIKIKDDGVGIEENKIKNLFNLHKNKTERGTNNEQGTGIGMIITKEYLDKMSGEISVDSSIGKGTEITVKLLIN